MESFAGFYFLSTVKDGIIHYTINSDKSKNKISSYFSPHPGYVV